MTTEIKEINKKRELVKFIKFQNRLYKGNKYFVPSLVSTELDSLTPEKNHAFEFCDVKLWLAYKDGKIAGRIGGIINHNYIKIWNKKQARFCWFDCIEDEEVAFKLLQTVESWAKGLGMIAIYGPYGFTNLDKHGLLVDGFKELATKSSNYNYPYYKDFIEKYGFNKEIDWVERQITVPVEIPERVTRLSNVILEKNKLHYKEINSKSDILKNADDLFNLYNESYAKLYGMVELSKNQINSLIKQYYQLLNKDLLALIYNEKEEIIAFCISMPSLSKALQKARGRLFPFGFIHLKKALKQNDTLDLLLIGVRPDYQKKGVNILLFNKIAPAIIRMRFKYLETTQSLETNLDVQNLWKLYDTRLHKRARSYIKNIA